MCLNTNGEDILLKCSKQAVKAAALRNNREQQHSEQGNKASSLWKDWRKLRQSKWLPAFCNNIWTHVSWMHRWLVWKSLEDARTGAEMEPWHLIWGDICLWARAARLFCHHWKEDCCSQEQSHSGKKKSSSVKRKQNSVLFRKLRCKLDMICRTNKENASLWSLWVTHSDWGKSDTVWETCQVPSCVSFWYLSCGKSHLAQTPS